MDAMGSIRVVHSSRITPLRHSYRVYDGDRNTTLIKIKKIENKIKKIQLEHMKIKEPLF